MQQANLPETTLEEVLEAIDSGDRAGIASTLIDLRPADIAHLLESLLPGSRQPVWGLLDDELRGEVLGALHEEVRDNLIDDMAPAELIAATRDMDTDDLAEIIESVPADTASDILQSLDQVDRERVQRALAYPEDTAGRLMDADLVSLRADVSIDVVLRYLRRHESIPPHTDSIMIVDKANTFIGALPLTRLLTAQPEQTVGELMDLSADSVNVMMAAQDVAKLFDRHDLISVAVIDDDQQLVGRITVDEIVDVIQEQADQTLLNLAGLDQEDDLFAPVLPSALRRALWLGINLLTALLAAWVIGLFQVTLEKVVALAVLMPVVASMGGIAGTQTLTLAIRGLALGQIKRANARWLALRELAVGALNGVGWALLVAVVAVLWFGDWLLGGVIAAAVLINMLAAAVAGTAVPLALKRLKLDPALSGPVILTTVSDVVGFLSFLGLGTMILL